MNGFESTALRGPPTPVFDTTRRAFRPRGLFGAATVFVLSALFSDVSVSRAADEEVTPGRPVDFTRDILPVFRQNCIACHNEKDADSDLILESPKSILAGGFSGDVVVPGDHKKSLLWLAAAHEDEPFMPPKRNKKGARKLNEGELALLARWIDEGAKAGIGGVSGRVEWQPLPPGVHPVYAASISPDATMAACGRANQVFVYELGADGKPTGSATRLSDVGLSEREGYAQPGVAHLDLVQSVAFHPTGERLASSGFRTVKIWSRSAFAPAGVLPDVEPDGARALSRDGRYAAHVLASGAVRVVDLSGELGGVAFWDESARVGAVAFQGALGLVAAFQDGSVGRWTFEAAGGRLSVVAFRRLRFPGDAPSIDRFASLGSERLITASADGAVSAWKITESAIESIATYSVGDGVRSIDGSPDGSRVLVVRDEAVDVRDALNGEVVVSLGALPASGEAKARIEPRVKLFESRIAAAKKTLDGAKKEIEKAAAAEKKAGETVGNAEKKVAERKEALAKAADEKAKKAAQGELTKAENELTGAQRAKEDAVANRGRAEKLAQQRANELAEEEDNLAKVQGELGLLQADGALHALSARFSEKGESLIVALADGAVSRWKTENAEFVSVARARSQAPARVAGDAERIVAWYADGSTAIGGSESAWRLDRTIGSVDDPSVLSDRVLALDFSPDGRLVATGGGEPSRGGELKIFDVESGELVLAVTEAHSDALFAVGFSPCGRYVAAGGADRFARIFRVEDGSLVGAYEGHSGHVLGVAWSGDGKTLASSGADNVIKVWNVETREPRRTIGGFGKQVTDLRFVGFSDRLLSSSGDRNVRLHNAGDGKQVRAFGGSSDFVYTVDATPDGKVILAGGYDSILRLWNGEDGKPIAELGVAGGN